MNTISHQTILEISQNFGTPTYIYNSEIIKKRFDALRNNLPDFVEIFYSMKANPTLGICEYLKLLGSNCEVCSKIEFLTAIKAGFLPDQIIFVGPGKTIDEITLCIAHKIKFFICESIDEIKLINKISKKYKLKTNILIRINPNFKIETALIKMSGTPSQFGIDEKTLNNHFNKFRNLNNINIAGIQVYNASRVLDIDSIVSNVKQILDLSNQLKKLWKIEFTVVDIGGGLGVPYFEHEQEINIEYLAELLRNIFLDFSKENNKMKIMMELGRYLVAESGFLISKINYIKNTHDKHYAVVDSGLHCHMAATGLGSFVQRNFPIEIIQKNTFSHQKLKYQISGPLCTPNDILFKNIMLPEMKIGDLVVIKNSGAYGLTASLTRFLSHGIPAEIFLYKKNIYLIRERESVDEILLTQKSITQYM